MTNIEQSVQEAMRLADEYVGAYLSDDENADPDCERAALESHLTAAFADVRAQALEDAAALCDRCPQGDEAKAIRALNHPRDQQA